MRTPIPRMLATPTLRYHEAMRRELRKKLGKKASRRMAAFDSAGFHMIRAIAVSLANAEALCQAYIDRPNNRDAWASLMGWN